MEKLPINKTVQSPEPSAQPSRPEGKKLDRERLKKACSDFEALLLVRMLKVMRESIPPNGVLGNGPGKEIYQSFMDQEVAKKMSQRGGIGLGEKLYRQVLRREEKGNAAGQDRQAEASPKVAGNESR